MTLDLFTVSLLTALVVVVTSTVFIVGMLLRKDEAAGRTWGLAFLAALLTVVAYLAWAADPTAWWAVGIGNGAFICGNGFMWLGARRYNGRPMSVATWAVAAVAVVEVAVVFVLGAGGGDWAGAEIMFLGILVFAALGARECLRGAMGRHRESIGLAAVLGLQAVFYLVRTGVFFAFGPQSDLFLTWFATVQTSVVTITLSIVAVVVTSVLLSGRQRLRSAGDAITLEMSGQGILSLPSFQRILVDMCERARVQVDPVGVISLRIDDVPSITTAYGSEAADAVLAAFRAGARTYAPSSAFLGEDGPHRLVVGIQPATRGEARRIARRLRRGLFDELGGVMGAVLPLVEVSLALSEDVGYDADELVRAARDAAPIGSGSDASDLLSEG